MFSNAFAISGVVLKPFKGPSETIVDPNSKPPSPIGTPPGCCPLICFGGSKKNLFFPFFSNVLKKFVSATYVFILAAVLIYCFIGSFISPSKSLSGSGMSCLTCLIALSYLEYFAMAPPKTLSFSSANILLNSCSTASSVMSLLLFLIYVFAFSTIFCPSGVLFKVLIHCSFSTLVPNNLYDLVIYSPILLATTF